MKIRNLVVLVVALGLLTTNVAQAAVVQNTIPGINPGDKWGEQCASSGSFFACVAPGYDSPVAGTDVGRITIYYDGVGPALASLEGGQPGEQLRDLALMETMNGQEHLLWVAVGARKNSANDTEPGDPGYERGRAYLWAFMAQGNPSSPSLVYDASRAHTFTGERGGDELGSSVSFVGDVDGDGLNDIAVGAPLFDGAAGTDSGKVYVYSSLTGALLWSKEGKASGDQFGISLAALPDTHLAVGAWMAYSGEGSVWIFDLNALITLFEADADIELTNPDPLAIPGNHFGESVAAQGDGKLMVGAKDMVDDAFRAQVGRAFLFVPTADEYALSRTLIGREEGEEFGRIVKDGGDIDGDGIRDWMIGAWKHGADDRGRIYLLSGTDDDILEIIDGTEPGGQFGFSYAVLYENPTTHHGRFVTGFWQANAAAGLVEIIEASCSDLDEDGFGNPGVSLCEQPQEDCDDANPNVHPGVTETCNSIDDDCNGSVDEGFSLGEACEAGIGACERSGLLVCTESGNTSVCSAHAGEPSPELCNGVDDDCNGSVDETFTGLGDVCSVGIGACQASGTNICSTDGKSTVCSATERQPTAELCNGVDDDCNGSVDETFADLGAVCTVGQGACEASGHKVCTADGSATMCDAAIIEPKPEILGNGIDDDCNPATPDCPDLDKDGHSTGGGICGPIDCDDSNAAVHPGAAEILGNGIDDDCNAVTPDCIDADGDSYSASEGVCGPIDCNDSNAAVHPGALEVCNSIDDDCNGSVDEGFQGLGEACEAGIGACERTGTTVCSSDGKSTVCSAHAGEPSLELCNGVDDDCNGSVDEGWNLGASCSEGVGACKNVGVVVCDGHGGNICSAQAGEPSPELCNGIDDNCDGTIDDGFGLGGACSVGIGACERHGHLVCAQNGIAVCDAEPGTPDPMEIPGNGIDDDCNPATPDKVDADGDGYFAGPGDAYGPPDCNDSNAAVYPGALEVCNGADDDCDGTVDVEYDLDVDGYTQCGHDCTPGGVCVDRDCNDFDAAVYPGALEVCNFVDDDCNGDVDEGFDLDGDGYKTCQGDCDDRNVAVHPEAVEYCNFLDDNCDFRRDNRRFDEEMSVLDLCEYECHVLMQDVVDDPYTPDEKNPTAGEAVTCLRYHAGLN